MGELIELDKSRDSYLKRKYGISIKQYEQMLKSQGGKCLGCGWVPREGKRRLHVDHNHTTGKVRGLLCWKCNTAVKWMRDSAQTAYNLSLMLRKADG